MSYESDEERKIFHEYLEQNVDDAEGFREFLSLLPPELFKIYAIKIAAQWSFDPRLVLEELTALVGDWQAEKLGVSDSVKHTKIGEKEEELPVEEFTCSDTEFAAKSWGIIL